VQLTTRREVNLLFDTRWWKGDIAMAKYLSVVIALIFISIYAFAQEDQDYQNYVKEIESVWDKYSEAKEFEKFQQEQDAAFQAFVREQEEAYRKYVEEVKRKWNEFIGSTQKEWVDYDEDKSVRSIVNFEEKEAPEEKPEEKPEGKPEEKPREEKKGQITVEAIVPADAPDPVDKAKELIANQIERIFSATNEAKKNVLEGQVKTKTGEDVTPENVKKFVQEEVLPEAKAEPEPLKSEDGVERVKVSVVIPMVPEHLRTRAGQYLPSARKYCDEYKEDLPLVMAVIQTESYFNPLAKSYIPAYGLMQLVPKYGGRDAYRYVFKKDEAPTPAYHYVPANNLLLGIAYLRLLRDDYFYGIKDPEKQEYLIVASYNGGMGRVIRRVLRKYNVRQMSPSEVYEVLRTEMPDETKDYLAKVTSRKKNYLAWQ
jgi:membrane-bound lytic murein transglycosylase C